MPTYREAKAFDRAGNGHVILVGLLGQGLFAGGEVLK
jgi:hypothetical protein